MRSPFPALVLSYVVLAVACGSPPVPASSGSDASSALDPLTDDASPVLGDDAGPPLGLSWDASFPAFDAGPPPWLDATAEAPDPGDAAALDATAEADAAGTCTQPLGPGVLVIDELLVASVAGSGDYGEWLEVASASDCAVNLRGLLAECPSGSKVISLAVASDLWLPPRGTFVIADSIDPAINHGIRGAVLGWTGEPGDALRNEGGTVTLSAGGVLVDSVTYPYLKTPDGTSIAFPAGCPLSRRGDWTAWQPSIASWFPGFHGTPNAPNADVTCP